MYPLWIELEYQEFGEKLGYMGSVTSRNNLVEVVIRLGLNFSDVHSFIVNDEKQPLHVIQKLFEEVDKVRGGRSELKQGKRPTNKQKDIIKSAGLRPDKWLVVKNLQHELHIVHRVSNNLRVISI